MSLTNPFPHRHSSYDVVKVHTDAVTDTKYEKPYRLTPFIITFTDATLTSIDIQNFIEMGLHIVRFKMTHITHKDKLKLIDMINEAVDLYCKKFAVAHWPIAVSIDVPNCMIRTGLLRKGVQERSAIVQEDSIVEITCDIQYYNKCDEKLIYIDDPYMIKSFKVGMELSIRFGEIVMFCTEILSDKSILCQIHRGSYLESMDFVCVRGVTHTKPPLTKRDHEIIEFAKHFDFDILSVNSVRRHTTLQKVKQLLGDCTHPLILSTICEQEGLDNIDKIIEECDGIILARENVANEIVDKYQMMAIQLQVAAKCRKAGKPFYISGGILDQTLRTGNLCLSDISDITNAVLHGAGFVLKDYNNVAHIIKAMSILNSICKSVEPLAVVDDFWRLHLEFPFPVNAADSIILGCALSSRHICANVIIIPTVTGHTAKRLVSLCPMAIILTISSSESIAKRLQLYRGIVPIIYNEKRQSRWPLEMDARIAYAVQYGIKHRFLTFGQTYVALTRSSPICAYADKISFYKVQYADQNCCGEF